MEKVKYRYSVVTFLELPYKDIDGFICVPKSWVRSRSKTYKKVIVAYPTENPLVTRERARRRQKFSKEWKHYIAFLRYETDYFDDAEIYIKTICNNGTEAMSNRNDSSSTSSSSSLDRKTRSSKLNVLSNPKIKPQMSVAPFNDNERSVMKLTIQRLSLPLPDVERDKKRQRTDSTGNVTDSTDRSLECPKEIQHQKNLKELLRPEKTTKSNNGHSISNIENEVNPNNSADQPTNPRIIAEQDFMNEFSALLTKFNTMCTETRAMFSDLSDTFTKSEETLGKVMRSIDDYNELKNNNTAVAVASEVGQNIFTTNQSRNDEINIINLVDDDDDEEDDDIDESVNIKMKAPETQRIQNIRPFTLPPEYDPNDTKWTLKHREYKPGLEELMPLSRVFVNSVQLANCKRVSRDCKTLARMLLVEIFSRSALSVCSLTGARAHAFTISKEHVRPGLNEYARMVLFTFVEEYGRKKGWCVIENHAIVNSVRSKVQDIRANYGRRK